VQPLVQYEKRQPEQQVGAQMRLSVAPMMDWNGLLFFHRFLAVWCSFGEFSLGFGCDPQFFDTVDCTSTVDVE